MDRPTSEPKWESDEVQNIREAAERYQRSAKKHDKDRSSVPEYKETSREISAEQ